MWLPLLLLLFCNIWIVTAQLPTVSPTYSPTSKPVLPLPPLWNSATDPLPPIQPKEYSYESLYSDFYEEVATGYVVANTNLETTSFYSYSKSSSFNAHVTL
jgi:hypothetical protein